VLAGQLHDSYIPTPLLLYQALYGRTDGLYSRAMLSKGLKDQRVLTERLEKMLIAQTGEMEECKEFMDR
jgi:hypothetical protein